MSEVTEAPKVEKSATPSTPPQPTPVPSTPPSSSVKKKIESAVSLDALVNKRCGDGNETVTTSPLKLVAPDTLLKGGTKGPSKRSPKSDRGRFKPRAGERAKTMPPAGKPRPKVNLYKTNKDKLTRGKGKKKKAEKAFTEVIQGGEMFDIIKEKAKKERGAEEAEEAEDAEEEDKPPPPTVTGKVKIRYNHYTEEMELSHPEGGEGSIAAAEIVDLLALDFAFNGTFITHLNEQQKAPRSRRKWQDKEGLIKGLKIGEEYWVDVDEDEAAEAAVERVVYNAAPAANDPMGGKREVSRESSSPCCESARAPRGGRIILTHHHKPRRRRDAPASSATLVWSQTIARTGRGDSKSQRQTVGRGTVSSQLAHGDLIYGFVVSS